MLEAHGAGPAPPGASAAAGPRVEDDVTFQLVARTGQPTFGDLPWHLPLAEWQSERLVEVARGIHRHVVRFVSYGDALYALKELPERIALREYRLLRRLDDESVMVVQAVGVVTRRRGREQLEAVLITRYLDFSLPYRTLFAGTVTPDLRNHLLDALAGLLVRLHLTGFFWGDCSLSNTLFRRDAGALAAYLVDAETGEMHGELSDGQRRHDLEIAELHVAGELMDVEAAQDGLPAEFDPVDTAAEIPLRYQALYDAVTHEEVFGPDETYRIEERLRRLNELGFDVEEIELLGEGDRRRLRLDPRVVEAGHHRRRLLMLTGLDVQENQARRLLNDIAAYRAYLERSTGGAVPESVAAYRWLVEIFNPSVAAVPPELAGKREPAELFHEILDHRWFLSEAAGQDIGTQAAVRSYVAEVLPRTPDERVVAEEPAAEPEDLLG
ncbi:MAG: Chromosome segregation ATPases [uncultured Thermoleophilia bacterium]|uniref:Chromosome segregation ATPases n=1 Tax=uncultured Thermoleophilia bacterium TaxID=1497501 RepID=A0A6J4TF67_9ACTN|nr:MAG: Chromosome segregation ATPases [uncultured Thermoleophilia bacterium]